MRNRAVLKAIPQRGHRLRR